VEKLSGRAQKAGASMAKGRRGLIIGWCVVAGVAGVLAWGMFGGWWNGRVTATNHAKAAATHANAFGFRLFNEVVKGKEQENVSLSGASAAMALAMFHAACDGESRKVLAEALGYPGGSDAELASAYGDLLRVLTDEGDATIRMANGLFVRDERSLKQPFVNTIRGSFAGELFGGPLEDPGMVMSINEWCKRHTDGMIPDMMGGEDVPNELTAAIILNALCFKAAWEHAFKPEKTTPRWFQPEEGEGFTVPMMEGDVQATMWRGTGVGAARLPYSGGSHSLVLMMPVGERKLADVRKELTPEWWAMVWKALDTASYELEVGLPKLKLKGELKLNGPLGALGLGPALGLGSDYSRMADGMGPEAGLSAMVRQKIAVEVDEHGARAAAVTEVEVVWRSALMEDEFHPTFDRPFLYMIVEKQTGAILFLGQVTDPRKE